MKTNKVKDIFADDKYRLTEKEFDAAVQLAALTKEWEIQCPGERDADMEVTAAHWNEMARLADLFLVSLANREAPKR